MRRSTFAMLYVFRNKKQINDKIDVNDKNIEVTFVKYYKVVE